MRGRGESAGGTTYHSTTVRRVFFQLPSCGYWARFVSVRTCLVGDAAWFRFSVAVYLPQTEAVARVGIFLFVTPGTSLGLPPSQCGYRLVSVQRISAGSCCRQWSGKNMQASIVPRSMSVSQYTERISRHGSETPVPRGPRDTCRVGGKLQPPEGGAETEPGSSGASVRLTSCFPARIPGNSPHHWNIRSGN